MEDVVKAGEEECSGEPPLRQRDVDETVDFIRSVEHQPADEFPIFDIADG